MRIGQNKQTKKQTKKSQKRTKSVQREAHRGFLVDVIQGRELPEGKRLKT